MFCCREDYNFYLHIHVCLCACICILVRIRVCIRVDVCVCDSYAFVWICVGVGANLGVCLCLYVCNVQCVCQRCEHEIDTSDFIDMGGKPIGWRSRSTADHHRWRIKRWINMWMHNWPANAIALVFHHMLMLRLVHGVDRCLRSSFDNLLMLRDWEAEMLSRHCENYSIYTMRKCQWWNWNPCWNYLKGRDGMLSRHCENHPIYHA